MRLPLRSSHRVRLLPRACCALALLALWCPASLGDGCYIPPAAFKKLPEIPLQRAVLTWREGQEKMVVESTFKGEGDTFGWVIPLPAVPTAFEAASPGYMGKIGEYTAPEITHRGSIFDGNEVLIFFAACILIIGFALFPTGCMSCTFLICLLLWMVLLAGVVFPTLGGRSQPGIMQSGRPIAIEKQARVGNYQVEVVRAQTAQALDDWLAAGGFARLPTKGREIVGNLIREKWCFVAAKLQRDGAGVGRPHPMSLQFPAKELVYPMRLTALAESAVYLDLFVIADRRAASNPLALTYCEQFNEAARFWEFPKSMSFEKKMGFWQGCTLTRLEGRLTPAQMTKDIAFQWRAPEPYRPHLYSRTAAGNFALRVALALWDLLIPILILVYGKPGRAYYRAAAIGSLLTLVPAGAVYGWLPKTDVVAIPHYDSYMGEYYSGVTEISAEYADEHPEQKIDELRRSLAEIFSHYQAGNKPPDHSHFWGFLPDLRRRLNVTLKEGNEPGNYELFARPDGGIDLIVFTPMGTAMTAELREAPARKGK